MNVNLLQRVLGETLCLLLVGHRCTHLIALQFVVTALFTRSNINPYDANIWRFTCNVMKHVSLGSQLFFTLSANVNTVAAPPVSVGDTWRVSTTTTTTTNWLSCFYCSSVLAQFDNLPLTNPKVWTQQKLQRWGRFVYWFTVWTRWQRPSVNGWEERIVSNTSGPQAAGRLINERWVTGGSNHLC